MKFFTIPNADGTAGEIIPEFAFVDVPLIGDAEEQTSAARSVPLSERYHPDFVAQLVPYDPNSPPPEPPQPPLAVLSQVTMRQARLALLGAGKLAAVSAAIASLPSPQKEAAQIEWEYAATVERGSAFVQLMALALQLDEAALDALFTQAATL